METVLGIAVVAVAGLIMGSSAWPFKLMKKYQFEHWWFVGMLVGLIIMPWTITLVGCPRPFEAFATVPTSALVKANLFAFGWGIANVLCGVCFVRIGMALTGALLTGMGVSVGVTVPMIVKGSGLFKDAPGLGSPAGLTVLAGVGVMLVGVVLASIAGFGRDRSLAKLEQKSGSFLVGLIMAVSAGVLSCGVSFAFVYSQGPVVEAMKAHGAGEIPATFAVWAVGLGGGVLVNIAYPIYLLTRNKSWGVLLASGKELGLAVIIGINFSVAVALMGQGMLLLGALGASVGFGVQQAAQMTGSQGVGFISGEWRGVHGRPRGLMYAAICVLILAAGVMSYGNTLTKTGSADRLDSISKEITHDRHVG
ncbi:MAG: hypothetical protein JXQ73_24760 [Phycisphaerae bacterium]|nr:hypothetical protein [Phycisphaerae bacterium]